MPTIPQLERRSVTPQTRIATVDARGAASLGNVVERGINEVQGAYKEAQDKRDRYQLADAASKFSILKHQQDNAFDEDDLEYDTYVDRYTKNVDEGLNQIAQGINNPELRNLFMMENRPRVASGIERIRNKAFAVETDVQRANINSRLNGMREVILGDDDDERLQAIRDTKDLLESAKDSGYYSAEEMVKIEKAYTVDAAIGYVDTLPINRQRDALNSDFIKNNVPSDIVAKKLRALEGAEVLEQAQQVADSIIDMPMGDQDKELRKYSGELREEIKRQIDYNNAKKKKIKLNTDETLHQDWYMKVIRGEEGYRLEDLKNKNNKEFSALEVAFQKDLMNAARAAITSSQRKESDPEVIDKLHSLNANGKFEELRRFYKDNVGMLDSTDMDTWSKISNEGVIPEEYESKFTLIQQIDMAIDGVEMKDVNLKQQVRKRMNEWDKAYFKTNREDPSQDAIDNQLKNVIREVTLGHKGRFFGDTAPKDGGYFTESKPFIQMDTEEKTQLFNETLDNPEGATDENLNLILGDILESDSPDHLNKALNIGYQNSEKLEDYPKQLLFDKSLTNFEMLEDSNKEMLFETLRVENPDDFTAVLESLIEVNNQRPPTPDEILDGMRFIRDNK